MQEMILEQLYWPRITHNIKEYCKNSEMFQCFKSDSQKVAGLYAPLPVPNQKW